MMNSSRSGLPICQTIQFLVTCPTWCQQWVAWKSKDSCTQNEHWGQSEWDL